MDSRFGLSAETERQIQELEYKCFRGILRIWCGGTKQMYLLQIRWIHIRAIKNHIYSILFECRKLALFGSTTRHDNLSKIQREQFWVDEEEEENSQSWNDNSKDKKACSISTLVRVAEDREQWHAVIANTSAVTPQQPLTCVTQWDVMVMMMMEIMMMMNTMDSQSNWQILSHIQQSG